MRKSRLIVCLLYQWFREITQKYASYASSYLTRQRLRLASHDPNEKAQKAKKGIFQRWNVGSANELITTTMFHGERRPSSGNTMAWAFP